MRLVAYIEDGHAYLDTLIRVPPDYQIKPITFLIDTGASSMCILKGDVQRLGISPDLLEDVKVNTASGRTTAKLLDRVIVYLPLILNPNINNDVTMISYSKRRMLIIPLTLIDSYFIRIIFHFLRKTYRRIYRVPDPPPQPDKIHSILGMDDLSFFPKWEWDYSNDKLIMDS